MRKRRKRPSTKMFEHFRKAEVRARFREAARLMLVCFCCSAMLSSIPLRSHAPEHQQKTPSRRLPVTRHTSPPLLRHLPGHVCVFKMWKVDELVCNA